MFYFTCNYRQLLHVKQKTGIISKFHITCNHNKRKNMHTHINLRLNLNQQAVGYLHEPLTRVCILMCKIARRDTALNSSDNLFSYHPDNHPYSDVVYRRGEERPHYSIVLVRHIKEAYESHRRALIFHYLTLSTDSQFSPELIVFGFCAFISKPNSVLLSFVLTVYTFMILCPFPLFLTTCIIAAPR